MKNYPKLFLVFMLLLTGTFAFSQTVKDKDVARLNYMLGYSDVNLTVMSNADSYERLLAIFDKVAKDSSITISRIEIYSSASIEGTEDYNWDLVNKRNQAVKRMLQEMSGLSDTVFYCVNKSVDWDMFEKKVSDSDFPAKDDVLSIIANVPKEQRYARIKALDGGRVYEYLNETILPQMRSTKVKVFYTSSGHNISEIVSQEIPGFVFIDATPAPADDETSPDEHVEIDEVQNVPVSEPQLSVTELEEPFRFAVKTNLLYLGAGVANIGVDFCVSDNFSVELPVNYSPYTIKRDYKLRMFSIHPEVKYWFNKAMKGHYVALQGHVGWFNVALNDKDRYQDRDDMPLLGIGVNYGYSLPIYKNLSLEFSVGVGYAHIEYDVFYNVDNGISYNNGVKDYFGLTKAAIGIVYNFNVKK